MRQGVARHLEQNVVVQSAEQRMRAPSLDLYFTRAAPAVTSGKGRQTPLLAPSRSAGAVGPGA